jgi:hypothetical protein
MSLIAVDKKPSSSSGDAHKLRLPAKPVPGPAKRVAGAASVVGRF